MRVNRSCGAASQATSQIRVGPAGGWTVDGHPRCDAAAILGVMLLSYRCGDSGCKVTAVLLSRGGSLSFPRLYSCAGVLDCRQSHIKVRYDPAGVNGTREQLLCTHCRQV